MRLLRAVKAHKRASGALIAFGLLGGAIAIEPPRPVSLEMVSALAAASVVIVLGLLATCIAGPSSPLAALIRATAALFLTFIVMSLVSIGLFLAP